MDIALIYIIRDLYRALHKRLTQRYSERVASFCLALMFFVIPLLLLALAFLAVNVYL